MNDFLSFRKMITPIVIQIIFWIGVGVSVIVGFGLIIAGAAASGEANRYGGAGYGGGGLGLPGGLLILMGLLQIIFGPILVRISCELTILFFRIYETLTEIRDGGRGAAPAAQTYPQPGPAYSHPQI